MVLISDWLAQRARLSPDRLALLIDDERWSFAELEQQVTQRAQSLQHLGVARGDRVAVLAGDCLGYVELVHALPRIGAIMVPLNTRLSAAEIDALLDQSGATILFHDEQHAQPAAALKRHSRSIVPLAPLEEAQTRPSPSTAADRADRVDLGAVHTIIYTSGTTGRPKGAMLTCGNHWWSAIGSALNLGLHADDRWLACLPFFHVGGLSILFKSVIYGIPAIVHRSFDPQAVNQAFDEDGVTIASLVPAMLQRVFDARGERPFPPSLRCVLLGGGPALRSLLEACAARSVPVVQTYGLTEAASQVATLPLEDARRKLGAAGKPLFPLELRIERDGASAPPRTVGEITVRGPTVMAGYFGDSEATNRVLRDGWLYTGDLGYLDDEGYLYVVDRRDDLIITGGENVYPAEVEAVLLAHPAVAEAGVTGIPDDRWGQAVVAAVTLKAGETVTPEALLDFCRERLARYKVPSALIFVDALPRNAAGKLVRPAIRELRQPTDRES